VLDDLQSDEIVNATSLFCNVKELTLNDSSAIEGRFLSDAKQLTRLTLTDISSTQIVEMLAHDYPALQSLTLVNIDYDVIEIDLADFWRRHPNLVELDLRGSGYKYDLSWIDECSPALRKLTLWDYDATKYLAAIAKLDKLTTLRLWRISNETLSILKTSLSSQSLEELAIGKCKVIGVQLFEALVRFTHLENLTVDFHKEIDVDDSLLSVFHRLKQVRELSIGYRRRSITSDGLVNLVRHLPRLEQLSLHSYHTKYMQLQKSTYSRIREICGARNQQLMIRNYNTTSIIYDLSTDPVDEPFAEDNKQESVRFISLRSSNDDNDDFIV